MTDWNQWKSRKDNFAKYKMYKSILLYGNDDADYDFAIMIPTYKRSGLLEQAVRSAIMQTGGIRYGIYVVDNCAGGDTDTDLLMKRYCRKYDFIKYYRNQGNLGMFGNWNRCIELAPAPWFCILNDDDLLKKTFLQNIIPAIKHTQGGLLGTYRDLLDQRGPQEKKNSIQHGFFTRIGIRMFIRLNAGKVIPMGIRDVAYSRHFPCNPFVLNREKSIALGGFNDEFGPFADMVFHANMFMEYGAGILPDRLTVCRFSENASTKTEAMQAILETGPALAAKAAGELGMGDRKTERARQNAVVIEYSIFPGVKYKIGFAEVWKKYKLDRRYCSGFYRKMILLGYKLGWAGLLFRKREKGTGWKRSRK